MGCDQVVFGGKLQCISPGPPIPQESGQFMGKLPWEYLERRALEIANYSRTADEREREIIFSKSLVQVSHPLPSCPVWIWENDPNGFPVKRGWWAGGPPDYGRNLVCHLQISEPHAVHWHSFRSIPRSYWAPPGLELSQ